MWTYSGLVLTFWYTHLSRCVCAEIERRAEQTNHFQTLYNTMQTLKLEIEEEGEKEEKRKKMTVSFEARLDSRTIVAQTTLYTALHHVELISTTFRSHFVVLCPSKPTRSWLWKWPFFSVSHFLFLSIYVAIVVLSKCVNILSNSCLHFAQTQSQASVTYAIDKPMLAVIFFVFLLRSNEWPRIFNT